MVSWLMQEKTEAWKQDEESAVDMKQGVKEARPVTERTAGAVADEVINLWCIV
jgi:hypothetical protein